MKLSQSREPQKYAVNGGRRKAGSFPVQPTFPFYLRRRRKCVNTVVYDISGSRSYERLRLPDAYDNVVSYRVVYRHVTPNLNKHISIRVGISIQVGIFPTKLTVLLI